MFRIILFLIGVAEGITVLGLKGLIVLRKKILSHEIIRLPNICQRSYCGISICVPGKQSVLLVVSRFFD
jgi:hypothetical protein